MTERRIPGHLRQSVTDWPTNGHLLDELIHRRNPGSSSTDTFNHARQNRSHLLVFQRRHRARRRGTILEWTPPALRSGSAAEVTT